MLGTITITVGQRESEDVGEKDSAKEMAANADVVQDTAEDGQEDLPEIIEQVPSSESNLDELTQPTESQSNDVGFKKVFKFVGFKFTVKKDKSEKSDAVQLLTVKKDEAEGEEGSRGAGDHQEASLEAGGEAAPKDRERKAPLENAEDTVKSEQQSEDKEARPNAEADSAAEESKEGGDERRENEASKAPESPTSPTANETASPFKKFFTQGWAGWRKKTSFRKPKEDEVEAAEKKKEQEAGKVAPEENGKAEATAEQPQASEQPPAQEERGSVHDARLSAEYEKIELPCDEQADGVRGPSEERAAPLATEVFDEKVEIVAEVHARTEEQKTGADEAVASLPPEKSAETTAQVQAAEPAEEVVVMTREASVPGEDQAQPIELSPEEKASSQPPEGIVSEVELLSTQERTKVQGSPLKKLFSSTGLKKLSGKKQKGKRGAPAGEEEPGEPSHIPPAESPDSTDDQKGESSASSPEEPEEITCLEKGIADAPADGDAEEGATSDGEKKREGVTPWASFKKMVTPKKRVRRPSESDKEDEPEKTKSATLSSTESAASEVQEDVKASAEEQRPEEPKRKVDTSVSWEALICVGSSKKRARKASSSDDEGGPQTMAGDIPKPEEAGKDKEPGTDPIPAIPPEHDHGPGSSSPEQAGSPSEGEGVSTWESFKRLVTARKKSKSKLEEKNEDSLPGTGAEPSASDVELGKEESWVSIKKFIPGRKKKRLDGKQEQATLEDTGPAEVNEEDSDVPAVVPLSEYDAVEREKIEAQQAQKRAEKPAPEAPVYVSEELSKSLVHTVAVTVIDGTRAVTSMEERSPSWISASVTDQPEQGEDTAKRSGEEREEGEAIAEVPTGTKTLPESKEARADMVASEMALTSGAVTAAETTEAFGAEETTEASGAEETTEMVSAVSQLTDSPDTTEEATPVQEVEGDVLDLEGLGRRTQAVLQAVAEKVREESQLPDSLGPEDPSQATQKAASKILEKVEEAEEESTGLDVTEEMDSGLQVQVQETKTEDVQGKLTVQTTPERPPKGPEAPESVECSGLESPPAVETSGEVKSQEITRGQAITPDSVETLSDSEPTGSAPVAEFETLNAAQPDQVGEIHDGGEVVPHVQSEPTEAEAGPVQKEGRLFPPSCQSQEDGKDSCRPEEVLEQADKEASVETVATLSKTEVIAEADDRADEKTKDTPLADGVEGSTDTERMASQNQIAEGEPKDKVTPAAESEENALCADSLEVQPLSSPVQSETRVQAEGEKIETPPAQANGEKLEQTPARTVQAAPTVTGTVVDGENEVAGVGGSAPCLVSEETVSTEVQVQSSDAPLTPPVTAAEDRVIGATIEIVEAGAETLQSAEKPFAPEEKPSDEDQDSTARASKDAMPPGTGAPAEAGPDTVCADPDRDQTTPQEQMADKDPGQVVSQEVKGNMLGEEDSRAGSEVLAFESESGHLVHNVIEIAVGQFVSSAAASPELHPAGSEPQAQGDKADHPDAEKEDREPPASAQDETQSTVPKDEPEAATPSSVSTDQSDGAETIVAVEGEGSGAKGPEQLEGAALPSDAKSDVAGTRSVPEDAEGATSEPGGKTEESLLESEGAEKEAAVETQDPVPRGTDASGDLRRGTPDTNGPKLNKEEEDGQGEEFQKGPVQSASEKETKTQPQEETQKPEREAEKPDELPESTDIV